MAVGVAGALGAVGRDLVIDEQRAVAQHPVPAHRGELGPAGAGHGRQAKGHMGRTVDLRLRREDGLDLVDEWYVTKSSISSATVSRPAAGVGRSVS
jgi:hypothetical protein